MNRISTTSTQTRLQALFASALVVLTALTGAVWLTISTPAPEVVQLERVVIEGYRSTDAAQVAEVQQLPRVVIVGHRDATADGTQVAAACTAQTLC
jgi:hypothetical protein